MKKIIRLSESELTNLVRRIVKEQKEMTLPKDDIRVLKFSVNKKKSTAQIKVRSSVQEFYGCEFNSNCFVHPESLQDGVYTKDNFSGDVFVKYMDKKYRCKMEKSCQPI